MSLAPLTDTGAQSDTPAAEQETTLRQRMVERLQGEADPEPGKPEDLSEQSAEDGNPDDDSQGFEDDQDAGDADEEQADLEEGALADDEEPADDSELEEVEAADHDWEKRYTDLEKKFREVTANRKAIEGEMTETIESNIRARHELEDLTAQVQTHADYYLGLANQAVNQWENFDWSSLEPEQKAAAKQQYAAAERYRDQLLSDLQVTAEQVKQAQNQVKQREAEIAKRILKASIPQWGDEHYAKLRDKAANLGYTPEEFNEVTDHRFIQLIHRAWEQDQAAESVQNVQRKRKAKRPGNQNARQPERNERGRFKQQAERHRENPGNREHTREFFRQKLAAERKERGGR